MRDLDTPRAWSRPCRLPVRVPVTLKMRLGWDCGSRNAPDPGAAAAEAAGVSPHHRARAHAPASSSTGAADWPSCAASRTAVQLPVVINGDIVLSANAQDAVALRQPRRDGGSRGYGAP
jgi:tRNA-dihydrouridine synthase